MYDVIIVLGSKPSPPDWKFPSHVYKSLNLAAGLLASDVAPLIAVSGKWALHYDALEIQQPFTEASKMTEYLKEKGVPAEHIVQEDESKDTIANLYYLKKLFLAPQNLRKILVITADFRVERLKFLCHKILGPEYIVDFQTVMAESSEVYPHEAETLASQKKLLADMLDGDEEYVGAKFYDDPYYQEVIRRTRESNPKS